MIGSSISVSDQHVIPLWERRLEERTGELSARDDHADIKVCEIEIGRTEKLLSMKKYHVNGTRKSPTGSLLIKRYAFIWQRAQRLIYFESFFDYYYLL